MFEPTSRYYQLEEAVHVTRDGREVVYKRRRFLPQGEAMPALSEAVVADGDRLDLIAGRTLGDPQQFWRIADKQNALDPFELTAVPSRRLQIPLPR